MSVKFTSLHRGLGDIGMSCELPKGGAIEHFSYEEDRYDDGIRVRFAIDDGVFRIALLTRSVAEDVDASEEVCERVIELLAIEATHHGGTWRDAMWLRIGWANDTIPNRLLAARHVRYESGKLSFAGDCRRYASLPVLLR
jgi:hypothetical protein